MSQTEERDTEKVTLDGEGESAGSNDSIEVSAPLGATYQRVKSIEF